MKSIFHSVELLLAIPLGIIAAPVLLVVFAVKAILPAGEKTNKVIRMPKTAARPGEGAWTRHAV